MALIRYLFSPDEVTQAPAPVVDDGSGEWVAPFAFGALGAIAAGAAVALASTAAIAGEVAEQDQAEIVALAEEAEGPVLPRPPTSRLAVLYLPDADDVPAGALFGQPDEDLWLQLVRFAPYRAWQALPYLPDPDEHPAFTTPPAPPEEEYWAVATLAWPRLGTLYLPDPEELPAGALASTHDEDAPVLWRALAPAVGQLYLPDGDEYAPALSVDEDGGLVAGRPWPAPVVRLFADDDVLAAQPGVVAEEDAPVLARPWRAAPPPLVATADDVVVPQPVFFSDEDFEWRRILPLPPLKPARLWAPDMDDVVAGVAPPAPIATIVCKPDALVVVGKPDVLAIAGRLDALGLRGQADAYAVTGRADAYTITLGGTMPAFFTLSIPAGDDAPVLITCLDAAGAPLDLTGATLLSFAAKKRSSDTAFAIQKGLGTGITVRAPASAGLADLMLPRAELAALLTGTWDADVVLISNGTSGLRRTIANGALVLTPHPQAS